MAREYRDGVPSEVDRRREEVWAVLVAGKGRGKMRLSLEDVLLGNELFNERMSKELLRGDCNE